MVAVAYVDFPDRRNNRKRTDIDASKLERQLHRHYFIKVVLQLECVGRVVERLLQRVVFRQRKRLFGTGHATRHISAYRIASYRVPYRGTNSINDIRS
jgi:hypothetical protein